MRKLSYCNLLIWGFILWIFIFPSFVYTFYPEKNCNSIEMTLDLHKSQASTNPGNPTVLSDDVPLDEFFNGPLTYYFKTETVNSSNYQIVWYQTTEYEDEVSLALYSDSGYSNLMTSTYSINYGWVVFRPSTSQEYYLKVIVETATCNVKIGWEEGSSSLLVGENISGFFDSSDNIEIYNIYLNSASRYSFILDLVDGYGCYLYLYYLSSGSSIDQMGEEIKSEYMNIDDPIIPDFKPSHTGNYIIVLYNAIAGQTITYTFKISTFSGIYKTVTKNSVRLELYNELSLTQYITNLVAPLAEYNAIWVQPVSSGDNFNLFLDYESGNEYNGVGSDNGKGNLAWTTFHAWKSLYFYPIVYAPGGSSGSAYLGWCSYINITVGNDISDFINISQCIKIYQVYLNKNDRYKFELDVPWGADFNIFIEYSSGGTMGGGGWGHPSSESGVPGEDEIISNYQPHYSGLYAIYVARKTGSGIFTLKVNYFDFQENAVLVIFIAIIGLIAVIGVCKSFYSKIWSNQQPRIISREKSIYPPQKQDHLTASVLYCPNCGFIRMPNQDSCKNCGLHFKQHDPDSQRNAFI